MKTVGQWLMQKPVYAALIVLLASGLPLVGWFALLIMAVVTLRRGMTAGAILLLCALLPNIIYYWQGAPVWLIVLRFGDPIIVYLFAGILRKTEQWSWVIIIALAIGLLTIVIGHTLVESFDIWMQQKMQAYLQSLNDPNVAAVQSQEISFIVQYAAGLQIAIFLLSNITTLLVARYWQAVLFNAGEFAKEFRTIRIPLTATLIVIIVGLIAGFWIVGFLSMLLIIVALYSLVGLSFVHWWVNNKQRHVIWLWLVYLMLVLLLPYIVIALSLLAIADSMLNLRARQSI